MKITRGGLLAGSAMLALTSASALATGLILPGTAWAQQVISGASGEGGDSPSALGGARGLGGGVNGDGLSPSRDQLARSRGLTAQMTDTLDLSLGNTTSSNFTGGVRVLF